MQLNTGNVAPQDFNIAGRDTVSQKQVKDIFRENSCFLFSRDIM
jgi:hypothetical protein